MSTSVTTQIPIYRPERIQRRAHQLLILIFACAVLGCLAMVGGPAINDYKIEANPGRALARVVDVSDTRAIVEFQDDQGRYQSPSEGILYPTGLGEGQRVWVSYAKDNTNLVKVEGRKWTLAIIPALSVLAVATVVFALLWWLVNALTARYIRRKDAINRLTGSRGGTVRVTRIAPRTHRQESE